MYRIVFLFFVIPLALVGAESWAGTVTIRDSLLTPEAKPEIRDQFDAVIATFSKNLAEIDQQLKAGTDKIQRGQLQRDRAAILEAIRVAKVRRGGRSELAQRTFILKDIPLGHQPASKGLMLVRGGNGLALVNRYDGVVYHRDPWQGSEPTRQVLDVPLTAMDDAKDGPEWRGYPTQILNTKIGSRPVIATVVDGLPNVYRLLNNKNHEADETMAFLASLPGLPIVVVIDLGNETRLVSDVIGFDTTPPKDADLQLPEGVYEAD